ncbi:MAG: iron-sulfur cluster insertion protein ErpA [Zoogloea sp.]|uniref:iron-sulfur cluster insertion protein ErpA n=1 Tax=Zoogloea sp. TaxID=49181 RepID=UPI0026168B6C|nr:iron-sulfur cluster insertion protein ErpA [Zoogloea sp.]MDD3329471.1 iron-sulfur cluster insertion protein ErpA [Zoogloea sp.]
MNTPVTELPASVVFTPAAAGKVAELIAEEGNTELKLRVYVTGGGCSGFQYGFSFDEVANDDDLRIEQGGVTLLVDSMSTQYLMGAEIDYEDSLEGARFVIRNPNATSTCGCGSSFSM